MEMLILGIIAGVSIITNAVMFRKYSNANKHLVESEERVKDLDMVVSALQLAVVEETPKAKPTRKKTTKTASMKAKKEVVTAEPKKRGRKPKS